MDASSYESEGLYVFKMHKERVYHIKSPAGLPTQHFPTPSHNPLQLFTSTAFDFLAHLHSQPFFYSRPASNGANEGGLY